MAGSGKSTVAAWFRARSVPTIRLGDAVLEEVEARSLRLTAGNEELVREELRRKEGRMVLAKRATKEIARQKGLSVAVVLDGLYSLSEYLFFRRIFGNSFRVLQIQASPAVRYARLASRGERPLTRMEAVRRDLSELRNLEKGGPIALADWVVINESSLEILADQLEPLMNFLMKEM